MSPDAKPHSATSDVDNEATQPPVATQLGALLGAGVVSTTPLGGGFTHAAPTRVVLDDGRTVVTKTGTDERTRADVAHEGRILDTYGLAIMPRLEAFAAEPDPIVVIEDLSTARWPPPWPDPTAMLDRLDSLAEVPAHEWIPPLHNDRLAQWEQIVDEPSVALLRVVSGSWLRRVGPRLAKSAAEVDVEGDRLVHADIWSANVCFVERRGPVLIDWAGASRANPEWDRATFTLSFLIDEGELFDDKWPGRRPWSAVLAALKCRAVGLGTPDWADESWHHAQMADLGPALRWAAEEHGLPPPD